MCGNVPFRSLWAGGVNCSLSYKTITFLTCWSTKQNILIAVAGIAENLAMFYCRIRYKRGYYVWYRDMDIYDGELIINARETTDVTIRTSTTSEVITVTGGSSVYYDVNYTMRVTHAIEEKGWCLLYCHVNRITERLHWFQTAD